jgi:amino acid adenylation domain-containing protein
MSILQLFARLETLGINLKLVDGQLKINAPKGKLTPDLIDELKDKKPEIMAHLQKYVQKGKGYTSIEPAEKREYYKLSPAQKRLFIIQQMDTADVAYNMPRINSLSEDISEKKLEWILKKIIARHESLRMSFLMVDDEPVLRVHDETMIDDWSLVIVEAEKSEIDDIIQDFVRPFDLSCPPLLRVGIIKTADSENLLMLDMHHITTDGTSQNILMMEFLSLSNGERKELPGLRLQYQDYCQWLNHPARQQMVKRQENHWLGVFAGELPVLNLPLDFPRPEFRSFAGNTVSFVLGREETKSLKNTCGQADVTLYMKLLSIVNILLAKLSGQEDIIVGTPIAARRQPGLEHIVGMFVNTLAMRNYPCGKKSVTVFLTEVKKQTLAAYENQEYPFEELVDQLLDQRDTSRNPVFDVMFNLLNQVDYPGEIPEPDGPGHPPPGYKNRTSKFDLNFTCVEMGERLFFDLEYCSNLFRESTIINIIEYFKKIIRLVSNQENREMKLSEIEITTEREKQRLLVQFNDTAVDFPTDKTIHLLFGEQVGRTPDQIALVANHAALTYRELNARANDLAHRLRAKGVKPDIIVGLMVERSLEMIVGILAILKAGGAYLPIDDKYPEARKTYMLKDSRIKLLLTNYNYQWDDSLFIPPGVELVDLRDEDTYVEGTNQAHITDAANLVYMIYTSGSTGKPKGVLLEHRNLVNLLIWNFKFTNMDFSSVLQFATICFDASFHEIFSTLLTGGKLCLIPERTRIDILEIFNVIQRHKIQTLFLPMAVLKAIFNEEDYIEKFPGCVAHIQTAGEQVVVNHRFRAYLQENNLHLHNHYGPSETHVVTALTLSPAGEIPVLPPIGKPISNTGIFILDKYGNVQPVGVPGELCIGGIQVGRGYLNNPELTAEKFVRAVDQCPVTNERIYKTGDLARWLVDGNIEFLGRIDHQVKIRGFRIELGEIESLLSNHEIIKDSVVLAKEGEGGDRYLCAYIVPHNINIKEEVNLKELKDYLASQLPGYMVPHYFVTLEKIPVTSSGKIDRKVLLNYSYKESRPGMSCTYAAPSTAMEKIVADAWKEVLGAEEVGVNDNFFEIGGNSINILKLHGKLKKVLKMDTPVVKLFKYSTIHSLAHYLAEKKESKNWLDKELQFDKELTEGKDRLKERVGSQENKTGMGIAVIGMSGVFPGARHIHEFWENLKSGIESITFFSDGELEEGGVSSSVSENPDYVKAKGILAGAEHFDALFFGYTPREAQLMDPQVRIFHQCVWHALEDAGYDPFAYPKRIGLYAGSSPNTFWEAATLFSKSGKSLGGFQSLFLRNKDFLCTRISYKLSLKGPSFSVHTACSTSLVAIHLGVQALLNGECEMAIAGGVTISYPFKAGYIYQEDVVNSPDGHCRAFDINSRGTVAGNGTGVVVLKPLEAASADRDHIYAVIKGSAINNDGDRKVGYTAPSVEGQAEVIRAAQYMAGVEPETITYVETHGTGTDLGDPVEIEALKMVFNRNKKDRQCQSIKKSCGIGSVKTNVGHMDCAAGVGSFIKTVLALKHRLIPPSLHFNTSNPKLGLEESPFYVVSKLKEWKTDGYQLRAGVSSFGVGGTNVHMVLEEAPQETRMRAPLPDKENPGQGRGEVSSPLPITSRQYQLILLSAKTHTALKRLTQNLIGYIGNNPFTNLAYLAYTLQVGRRPMRYRKMCAGSNLDEVVRALPTSGDRASEQDPPVVFIFSGQGAQYVNMGLEIYRSQPVFRNQMDKCFDILKSLTGKDFKSIFYPRADSSDLDNCQEQMADAHNNGAIKFIFEYSLGKLLMSWGILPYAVMGHSFGEYAAACLAGVFSIEDTLKLSLLRGKLIMQTLPGGMMSVPLPQEQLNRYLQTYPDISLSAVNSSSLCYVSGTLQALERFKIDLQKKDIECMYLNVTRAGHSHMMKSITGEFENRVSQIKFHEPTIPFMSWLTGDWASPGQLSDPAYWAKHLIQPVRFCQAVEKLFAQSHRIFIQVGPDRGLPLFINQNSNLKPKPLALNMVRHKKDKIPDMAFLLHQLGTLWLRGVNIDWLAFHVGKKMHRISLPTYPFEGKGYWINEKFFHQVMTQESMAGMVKPEFIEEPEDSSHQARPGTGPGVTPEDNEENYQAPRNELEQNIARVWQEILGLEKIGIYDDFFHLNGDSLTATQLLSHIKKMYPVNFGLKDFFVEPTIAHLARMIKKLMIERIKNLPAREKERLADNQVGKKADQRISNGRSLD